MVHEKIKVSCELCEAMFASDYLLKNHVRSVHEGINPFKCPDCDSVFAIRSRLNQHVKQIHERRDRKLCILCNKTFPDNSGLKKHTMSVHEGIKRVQWRDKQKLKLQGLVKQE